MTTDEKFPLSRARIDVDNHLGYLMSCTRHYGAAAGATIVDDDILKTPYKLKPILGFDGVAYCVDNALPLPLATAARDFALQIPFDRNESPLDDATHPPHDGVLRTLQWLGQHRVPQRAHGIAAVTGTPGLFTSFYHTSESRLKLAHQWRWECYHRNNMFRAHPIDLEGWLQSPLYTVVDALDRRCRQLASELLHPLDSENNTTAADPLSYAPTQCVLQRMDRNYSIGPHTDEVDIRCLAFTYYLTPDDWRAHNDGGSLTLWQSSGDAVRINPTFNRLVVWRMPPSCPEAILHSVDPVTSPSDRARVAFVGFVCKHEKNV